MVIQIDMYEVDMESSLGGGNYGEVFKAHHRETKAAVAAKRILTTKIKNQKYIRGEIAALKAASGHPNIVSLLHHEQRGDILWLIMEYCEAGNIHEYLTVHTVTDQQAAVIIQDCVEAVHHLHNLQPQGIMHRDLKPENLLVMVIDGQPRIKVCDFGVSVMLSDDIQSTTYCGTGYYLAPEFFNPDRKGIKYDKSIDLFALGLIIWSILHRQPLQGLEPLTDSNDTTDSNEPIGYSWWKRDRLGEDWTPFEARLEDGLLDILVVQMTSFRPKDRLSIRFVKDVMNITKQGEDWSRFQTQLDDGLLEKLVAHMTSLTTKNKPHNRIIKNLLGFCFNNVRNRDVIDQAVQTDIVEDVDRTTESSLYQALAKEYEKLKMENDQQMNECDKVKKDIEILKVERSGIQRENCQLKTKLEADLAEKMKQQQSLNEELKLTLETGEKVKNDLDKLKAELRDVQIENCHLKSKHEAELDEKINHIKQMTDELKLRDDTIQSLTLVLPFNIVFAPPKFNKVANIEAAGSGYLGFGDGCVIVERGNDLDKWSVDCDPKPHLKKQLSAKRPQDVGRDSVKCILDNGCIVMNRYDTMTHVYSKDLNRKLGQHEGDFGVLRGAIGDKVLYCKEDKPGKCKLHLYRIKINTASSSHELVTTLPMEVSNDRFISVCGHHSGYIAVVDASAKTLDIYSSPSQHVRHVQLPFGPRFHNAVTSVGDIIVIADWRSLDLYNWGGTRLGAVTRQQLGIRDVWIHGIGHAGDRLLLAAGEIGNVSKLYVFDVCPDA